MHILRNFHLEYLEDLLFFRGLFYIQDNLLYLLLYQGLYLYCNFHLFLILLLKLAFYLFYLNYQIFYFFDLLHLYFETILVENKINKIYLHFALGLNRKIILVLVGLSFSLIYFYPFFLICL